MVSLLELLTDLKMLLAQLDSLRQPHTPLAAFNRYAQTVDQSVQIARKRLEWITHGCRHDTKIDFLTYGPNGQDR